LSVAEGPFDFGAQAFYTVDDNISRAQNDADIEKDGFYTVSGNAAYSTGFGRLTALIFSAVATVEEYSDFDGLSNTQLALKIDYRFQPSLRFGVWQWSIFAGARDIDSETDIRDGSLTEFGFTATKRLTDRITTTLGATASEREAEGDVFDVERTRYFGNIDWSFDRTWAAYLTYSYIDGDVFSTASPSVEIISWADAIEPDNAFGGLANNKFAYRLDAGTTVIRLGANFALGHSSSIDVSYDNVDTDAAGPNSYTINMFTLGYLHQF
jgi:hypothetical protein